MLVRFDCPACGSSHSFDMPDTVVHMTCSSTHKTLRLSLTKGGDVRGSIVDEEDDTPGGSTGTGS